MKVFEEALYNAGILTSFFGSLERFVDCTWSYFIYELLNSKANFTHYNDIMT